jgi:acetyl esterase
VADRVPPAELVRYFETHETPPGVAWDELLERHNAYMNDVGLRLPNQEEVTIRETAGWRLRIAIWRALPGPKGLVLHLHGGAWAAGNHLSFPGIAAVLVDAGYSVVSVDYRRAPRRPFPAAFDDCLAALRWCGQNAAHLGIEGKPIFVLGESAGANLAAAILAADRTGIADAGVLLYGLYDYHRILPTMASIGLPTDYVRSDELDSSRGDPRLSPARAARDLPPCLVLVGANDWALDESRALHRELRSLGREHEYAELEDTPHGFTLLPGHPGYAEGWRRIVRYLDERSLLLDLPQQ